MDASTNVDLPFDDEQSERLVFDAVASKRVLKTGYVRQPGGLHPSQCDTVASHSHAVTSLAAAIAYEVSDLMKCRCGVQLDHEKVLLLSIFHDHGETRSGDTGAQSIAIYGACRLYNLESDALKSMLAGLRIAAPVLDLYAGYRTYSTPEALVVHAADVIEGFEKAAAHFAPGTRPMADAIHILHDNLRIFRSRGAAMEGAAGERLASVGEFVVDFVIVPFVTRIAATYGIESEALLMR